MPKKRAQPVGYVVRSHAAGKGPELASSVHAAAAGGGRRQAAATAAEKEEGRAKTTCNNNKVLVGSQLKPAPLGGRGNILKPSR